MKKGNQFYLEFQIEDKNGRLLDISSVLKIQFTINDVVKIYDGKSTDVIYNNDEKVFRVWITEKETFSFGKMVKMDARVMLKGEKKSIIGTYIVSNSWCDSLTEEYLDV